MAENARIVVKIGGNALGPEDTTFRDLVAVQKQGVWPVVVHGGGPLISQWLDQVGVESTFVRGLRVTSDEALDVVTAVLCGLVNTRIVVSIGEAGGRGVGLTGADGAVIAAEVRDPELGRVGEVASIQTDLITGLLNHDFIPVFSPVSVDASDKGRLLNVNADSVAGALAGALEADRVIFMTDVPGVLDADGELLATLSEARVRELIDEGVITGGMIPKVTACLNALAHAQTAQIIDGRVPNALRDALEHNTGTRIVKETKQAATAGATA